ncbi:FTR1 family protein [Bacillus sp. RG28]|uniref:FTR1 family protein n=1 Tax=Gottfriedia endophytica TaxID=2820819 RepID=A0A940NQE5_9BACI|nr:FTR1 family protein [Gottfriedia endophytica]MBP0725865.1 FTR1 family protein [Gottfriedia endophytica]
MKKIITTFILCLLIYFSGTPIHSIFAESKEQQDVLSYIGDALTESKQGNLSKVEQDLLSIQIIIKNQPKTKNLQKVVSKSIDALHHNKIDDVNYDLRLIATETEKWISKTTDKKQVDSNKIYFLTSDVNSILSYSKVGNWDGAKAAYKQFEHHWYTVENSIRSANIGLYGSIESKMLTARASLFTDKPVYQNVQTSFISLKNAFVKPDQVVNGSKNVSLTKSIEIINRTLESIQQNKRVEALQSFKEFVEDWPYVEGEVQSHSMELYHQIENDTTVAMSQLSNPAKLIEAKKTIKALLSNLNKASEKASYSMIDAGTIVFREGLEALIIIAALLAIATKNKNQSAKKWIFLGGIFGIIASLLAGLAFKFFLSKVSAGLSNQLIEGISGLVAVVFMITVGIWLHNQSRQKEYGKTMTAKAETAIANGGIVTLSLLSFFSVFREGAETVVFYIGMSSSIQLSQLILGFLAGVLLLGIIGFFILKGSYKIPLKPFFLIASLCIYYLTFKFIGQSVHSLQAINMMPSHYVNFVPVVSKIGLYPSLESVIPQLLLVLFVMYFQFKKDKKDNNLNLTV